MEQSRKRAELPPIPAKRYFTIGEVSELCGVKPHVLRYWESQFRILNPAKNRSGNRVYARREVELVLLVKHLLYTEKYTIDGARQKLDAERRGGALRESARAASRRSPASSTASATCSPDTSLPSGPSAACISAMGSSAGSAWAWVTSRRSRPSRSGFPIGAD